MAVYNKRNFMVKLIEKYKQLPCLWQLTHESYHDKAKRIRALDELLELFKKQNPHANRETVQKKIGSIRGSYNKELRKVRDSLAKGDPESVHVPKLWYFNKLSFLQDQDSTRDSWKSKISLDDIVFDEEESNDNFDDEASPSSQHSFASSSSSRDLKRPHPDEEDELLEKITKRIKRPISIPSPSCEKPNQAHEAFGKHVSEKLRTLPKSMVPFCQKIINDAIFFAEMHCLNMSSRIVTDQLAVPASSNNEKTKGNV